jgi:hypothetical protein
MELESLIIVTLEKKIGANFTRSKKRSNAS